MRIVRGCPAGESRSRAGCGTPRAGAGDPVGLRLARAGHDCNFVTRPRARPRAHVSVAFPRRASPLSANRTVNQSRRPWERRPPRASRPAHDAPGTSAQPTDLPPRARGCRTGFCGDVERALSGSRRSAPVRSRPKF